MRREKTDHSDGRMLIATLFFVVLLSSSHAATTPEVQIANGPLLGAHGNVHPNMLLSLSIEFPAVGIAYRGNDGYHNTAEYIGYFNPLKCYQYSGGNRNLTDGYFFILKNADGLHECDGDSFSGNFMNWAASSKIDLLRYALTGGDRIVDTIDTTILQRAVLKEDFYANARYFPRRKVSAMGRTSAPNRVTPFNPGTLYVVSCRNRILFSDSANSTNDCDTPAFDRNGSLAKTDKKLGEYLVRVKVCDGNEGPVRTGLCHKYGANYKPIGELQRHSEKIRYAVMGYLLDGSNRRYGGVLRAPMKHIGARKAIEPGFHQVANENLEWDADTGVLYSNPEDRNHRAGAASNSGVINYINKFGRLGSYKTLDPVAELYYEGLRYLQGRPPTPDATAGMTHAMRDGFPVIDAWKDPVTVSCQKNYIVSIADADTHWDRYVPGNTRTTFNGNRNAHDLPRAVDGASAGKTPELDARFWTAKVAEMEADAAGNFTNPAPRANLANLQDKDTGPEGHGSYYMAGLAYWANTNDIRLDKPIRVKSFSIDVDEGGNGLVDGSSRTTNPRDSQLYLAAKYGGFSDRNKDGNPFISYAPDGKSIVKNDNSEWEGTGTGIPANYFLAGRPDELVNSILKIFSRVANREGTTSSVAVSATRISIDGASIYQAGFNTSSWSGSLKKLAVSLEQDGMVKVAPTALWEAADRLTGNGKPAKPSPEDRNIYTSKRGTDKSWTTMPFKWNELAPEQQVLLNLSPVERSHDGLGEKRVDYLRGVRRLESDQPGGLFRHRDSVLGDIINSNPVHVGAPAETIHGDSYRKFFDANKSRAKAVYVGANDGMLHAFAAADGNELFAYIPNALIPALNQLTAADYVHRPYVDGGIAAGEALVSGNWKTVLAAGMGGGAQGVFALDVSNPSDFGSGAGALWEFTDNDDADMGNLISPPIIARFKTRMIQGVPQYQYFVVVPSGLNNYRPDGGGKFSETAQGALFLLSLDKGPSAQWKQGVNYYKLKLPLTDAALQNGIVSPTLVAGNDGAVRYAYAGDLQGNLWRLDFKDVAPWTGALGRSPHKPLFTARDARGKRQPITAPPEIVFAPGGGYVVLFGTGKFLEDADAAPGNYMTQSFYGIYDTAHESYKIADRNELAPRPVAASTAKEGHALQITGNVFSYGTTAADKKGWYFDFADSWKTGERSTSGALIANGKLIFNSQVPGADLCAAGGGRSYFLDALSGLPPGGMATGTLSTAGLPGSPILFETGIEIGGRSPIGRRTVKRKYSILNPGSGSEKAGILPAQDGSGSYTSSAGRLSWREVINWQELRDAVHKK
jgi:type IV pilus assembly protein PilY1